MHKGLGKAQQERGHKRKAKILTRHYNKHENLAYVAKLMHKYGKDLNLKNRVAGEKYIEEILGIKNNDE
jgi:hypothetical protein